MKRGKLPPPPKPPTKPGEVKIDKPSKAEVAELHYIARTLLDDPKLLAKPEWRQAMLRIARAFVALTPQPRMNQRYIAGEVEKVIDIHLRRGMSREKAVISARTDVASLLNIKRELVKKAHNLYGNRQSR